MSFRNCVKVTFAFSIFALTLATANGQQPKLQSSDRGKGECLAAIRISERVGYETTALLKKFDIENGPRFKNAFEKVRSCQNGRDDAKSHKDCAETVLSRGDLEFYQGFNRAFLDAKKLGMKKENLYGFAFQYCADSK